MGFFFFFFFPFFEPPHPFLLASSIFFAALRSARLGLRVMDEWERRPTEVVEGAESSERMKVLVDDSGGELNDGSMRSTAGRIMLDAVGRGCRGIGARIGVSVRGTAPGWGGGSKAPLTPPGVLMMSGTSSRGEVAARFIMPKCGMCWCAEARESVPWRLPTGTRCSEERWFGCWEPRLPMLIRGSWYGYVIAAAIISLALAPVGGADRGYSPWDTGGEVGTVGHV